MKLYCNKDIKGFHSRIYDDFVKDYRYNKEIPLISYPEEYNGERILKLYCSQHSKVVDWVETISDYQRKKITDSWEKYLLENRLPIKEVQVCSKMPHRVFDALCSQTSIESMRIKWFDGTNIDKIRKLTNLKKLFIESVPRLTNIEPIADLLDLEVLILGNTKKINDYKELGKLKNLKVFSICSYQTQENITQMSDDSFMFDMHSLDYVDMCDVRVKNQVFLVPENVKNMEFAAFYNA